MPSKHKHKRSSPLPPPQPQGFLAAVYACLCPSDTLRQLGQYRTGGRGRPATLGGAELILGLVFHYALVAGTLAQHLHLLFGRRFAESSLSGRRAALPWSILARLLARALRPLARRSCHPDAFFGPWRLTAIDGTQFSLQNTRSIRQAMPKARSRRGRAAFAKLHVCVLLELGSHQPLALAVGRQGQAEWALSVGLLSQLSKGCLLLADRLYGCAAFAARALDRCQACGSAFLFRVRSSIKVQVVKRLKDGSRLVRVPVRDPKKSNRILRTIEVREIRVTVARSGFKSQTLRLWTSLLDPKGASARQLAQLYAKRWEHELFYRQLKVELAGSNLLKSQTVDTAAQEVCALILVASLVAHQRAQAGNRQHPVHRISFVKTLELLRPLWMLLALGEGLLTDSLVEQLWQRALDYLHTQPKPKRRPRSCRRAVRQPVTKWPRLITPEYHQGPVRLTVLPFNQ